LLLQQFFKYGTPKQREIIKSIEKSSMLVAIENIVGSGDCGVTNRAATQKKIDSQEMNEVQALGELTLRIHPTTASTNAGLEGTLVHETRHAYHQARAISEFSQAHKLKRQPYNPDGFTIEYAAHISAVEYVLQAIRLNHPDKQVFINEAFNSLGIMKKVGKNYSADETGIRNRLSKKYTLNDTTLRGKTFGDHWSLTPRNSW
jgi:hypothetical protein